MSRYRLDHLWIVALLSLIAVAAIASYCRVSPAPDVTDPTPTPTHALTILPTATLPVVTMSPVLPTRTRTPTPYAPFLTEPIIRTPLPTATLTPVPTATPTPEPPRTPSRPMEQKG